MNQGSQKGRPAPRPGEAWIHEDMSEEELLDMPRPVRIDPIDRSLPTDADKARVAAKLREPGCADNPAAFRDAVAVGLHSALNFDDADVGAQELLEMLADLIDPAGPVLECRLCGEKVAQRAGDKENWQDGLYYGISPKFTCQACRGSWYEGWV